MSHTKRSLSLCLSLLGSVTLLSSLPAQAELTVDNSPVSIYEINVVSDANARSSKDNDAQQVPTDVSLIQLLRIMRLDDMMQTMTSSQSEMVRPLMASALSNVGVDDLSEKQREALISTVTRYSQQLTEASSKEIIELAKRGFVTIAKNHYTQAEVDAQIAFYGSSIGQSILNKQPKLMEEYMLGMMPDVMVILSRYQEKLMPQLERDIDKILGQ